MVGAWVATSTENKTTTNLAWLFLRPIWPSRIPLTMYFDGRGTLRRKWRRFVIFFLSWLFAPFILLLAFYLIMSFARFCNLKKLPFWGARVLGTSSNHRRRSRRGGECHEGSSGSRPQPHHFPAQLWKLQTVQGKNLKIKAIFLTFQMWYYSRL